MQQREDIGGGTLEIEVGIGEMFGDHAIDRSAEVVSWLRSWSIDEVPQDDMGRVVHHEHASTSAEPRDGEWPEPRSLRIAVALESRATSRRRSVPTTHEGLAESLAAAPLAT